MCRDFKKSKFDNSYFQYFPFLASVRLGLQRLFQHGGIRDPLKREDHDSASEAWRHYAATGQTTSDGHVGSRFSENQQDSDVIAFPCRQGKGETQNLTFTVLGNTWLTRHELLMAYFHCLTWTWTWTPTQIPVQCGIFSLVQNLVQTLIPWLKCM